MGALGNGERRNLCVSVDGPRIIGSRPGAEDAPPERSHRRAAPAPGLRYDFRPKTTSAFVLLTIVHRR